jgi:hypothetical protein
MRGPAHVPRIAEFDGGFIDFRAILSRCRGSDVYLTTTRGLDDVDNIVRIDPTAGHDFDSAGSVSDQVAECGGPFLRCRLSAAGENARAMKGA